MPPEPTLWNGGYNIVVVVILRYFTIKTYPFDTILLILVIMSRSRSMNEQLRGLVYRNKEKFNVEQPEFVIHLSTEIAAHIN